MPIRRSGFDWDDLKFFVAAARAGTVRGAAEILQANHATVSRRLSSLEGALGARLFDRSREGLKLTQLGEDMLPVAKTVEEGMAAASRVVAGRDTRPTGTIFVSIPHFLLSSSIADDFAAFGNAYEEIELQFDVSDNLANLERREADVSIRYAHEVTEDVVGRILAHCTKAAYCTPEYAAKVENNGGRGLQWIGWNEEDDAKTAAWVKSTAYPNATLRHRVMEGNAHLALAKAGVGLTFIPCFVGDAYQGLVRAPFQTPVADRKLWLLLHRDLRETARVRLFIDFLAERITARRAEFDTPRD